jgi:hypothetical protein
MRRLRRENDALAARASRRLTELMSRVRAGEAELRRRKMRLISLRLGDWQVEGAKLVAEIRGGSYRSGSGRGSRRDSRRSPSRNGNEDG